MSESPSPATFPSPEVSNETTNTAGSGDGWAKTCWHKIDPGTDPFEELSRAMDPDGIDPVSPHPVVALRHRASRVYANNPWNWVGAFVFPFFAMGSAVLLLVSDEPGNAAKLWLSMTIFGLMGLLAWWVILSPRFLHHWLVVEAKPDRLRIVRSKWGRRREWSWRGEEIERVEVPVRMIGQIPTHFLRLHLTDGRHDDFHLCHGDMDGADYWILEFLITAWRLAATTGATDNDTDEVSSRFFGAGGE